MTVMLTPEDHDHIREMLREELHPIKQGVEKMTAVAEELTQAVEGLESQDSALATAVAEIAPEFASLDAEVEALNKRIEEGGTGEVTVTKEEAEALTTRVTAVGTKLGEAAATVSAAVASAAGTTSEPGPTPGASE